jgi:hypothetical protein
MLVNMVCTVFRFFVFYRNSDVVDAYKLCFSVNNNHRYKVVYVELCAEVGFVTKFEISV